MSPKTLSRLLSRPSVRMGLSAGIVGGGIAYGIKRRNDPEQYALYLGGKRGQRQIPARNIDRWMRREVDPHLEGYSVVRGTWQGVHEPTRVLTYLGPRKYEPKVRQIGESYRKRFGQQSVLMTSRPAPRMTFLS